MNVSIHNLDLTASGEILLYVREDIPAKLLSHDFPCAESFFVEINLYKKKWLTNCSYNRHKNNIENHLDKSVDSSTHTLPNTKILYLVILIYALMMRLCRFFANFIHLIVSLNSPHALKSPSSIDLMLSNKPRSF